MTGDDTRHSPLVIGIGNDWRRDDAVGLIAARRLRGALDARVTVIACSGDTSALLHLWQGRSLVVLVDAMDDRDGGCPGDVLRFDALGSEGHLAPTPALHSTHALGVADALALGGALDMLPARLVIYAMRGEAWGMGAGLSPAVEAALPALCVRVATEVAAAAPAALPVAVPAAVATAADDGARA